VQRGSNLDLPFRGAKTKLQAIERILDVVKEPPISNLHDVVNLFDSRRIVQEFPELSEFPL
jgi:hypothetical protein